MIIYLLRHGEASRPGPEESKSLTSKGVAEVTQMAEYFKAKKVQIDAVWHSSKTRAIQTAGIFIKIFGIPASAVEEKKELKPEGDAKTIAEALEAYQGGNLLVVSHLPFLADLAGRLLEGSSAARNLTFPTGGVCAIERAKTFKYLGSFDPDDLKAI
jgi:phosphohistidine phosphatase